MLIGQSRKTVHGNHNVIKTERNAGSFTGIKVSSGVDVYLKQGDNESITVEADENLHEYIITEVKGGCTSCLYRSKYKGCRKERVYVTMKDINSLRPPVPAMLLAKHLSEAISSNYQPAVPAI